MLVHRDGAVPLALVGVHQAQVVKRLGHPVDVAHALFGRQALLVHRDGAVPLRLFVKHRPHIILQRGDLLGLFQVCFRGGQRAFQSRLDFAPVPVPVQAPDQGAGILCEIFPRFCMFPLVHFFQNFLG